MAVRKYIFAGIATIFPLFVTAYILIFFLRFADGVLGKYVNRILAENFGYTIPGLGFFLLFLFVISVGFLSVHLLSKKFIPWFERVFAKIPLVNHIYLPARQLAKFAFGTEKQKAFSKVVLIRYPNDWSYSIGFMTNETLSEFNRKTGVELVSVLVSTPPNPFTGPIILVPREKVILLDIPVAEAMKFVISGGVVFSETNQEPEKP